jgi:hypothetical protein
LPILPTAVRLERRRAVRTNDPQILEAVVVRNAVDVVEDQRHPLPAPDLVLTAELTARCLDPFREQTALQMAAVIRGMLDEQFAERRRWLVQRLPPDRILVEVRGAHAPQLDVLLDRPVVAPCGAQVELAQRFAVRTRTRDRRAQFGFGEADLARHEHMFARPPDRTT